MLGSPAVLAGSGFARLRPESFLTSGSEENVSQGRPMFTAVEHAASTILMLPVVMGWVWRTSGCGPGQAGAGL
jgi:hypothetical protein